MALESSTSSSMVFMPSNQIFIVQNETMQFDENHSNVALEESMYPQSSFINLDGKSVNDGLAVLEILFHNPQSDKPEFVDVSMLTASNNAASSLEDVKASSDEDVIFVSETKAESIKVDQIKRPTTAIAPRRNPIRQVRKRKVACDLEELICEEDFALLDKQFEEETKQKMVANIWSPKTKDSLKEWPTNVHDRPVYNAITKKIEKLDYNVESNPVAIAEFKPKLEKPKPEQKPKMDKKKPKKKKNYSMPKRQPKKIEEKTTVNVQELKPLVNSTLDMLKVFLKTSKEVRRNLGAEDESRTVKLEELLRNQATLYLVTNNADEKDFLEYFKDAPNDVAN